MARLIFADENIPFALKAFSPFGKVELYKGRQLTRGMLADSEILLVRSVTKVNETLIADSPVRFVATATAGLDHVDQQYLADKDVVFAHAKGSNAKSVGAYTAAALLNFAAEEGRSLNGKVLGVIGCGFVGKEVIKKGQALGMRVLACDPPLQESGDRSYDYVPLEELYQADVISMHTSLEIDGKYPSVDLADHDFFNALTNAPLFINASRGEVVCDEALQDALRTGKIKSCVLDVWHYEPVLDRELLQGAWLATPHIAGYSYTGKLYGTQMIHDQCASFLGEEGEFDYHREFAAPQLALSPLPSAADELARQNYINEVVKRVYDIERDSQDLKKLAPLDDQEFAAGFDRLRKEYPRRYDWENVLLTGVPAELKATFSGLGFQITG